MTSVRWCHSYDNEELKPYYYEVVLDEENIKARYAPSHQSAIYEIEFGRRDRPAYLMINSRDGEISVGDGHISGYQNLSNGTRVYIYAESDVAPVRTGILDGGAVDTGRNRSAGRNACAVVEFPKGTGAVSLRYGISFISVEQAEKNMEREIPDYDLDGITKKGRDIWNQALGEIAVEGGSDDDKTLFYTSLYRVFERPVCISEDGRYFSAFDGQVHQDEGTPFYTDDWIWDTYRAAHPLRILIDEDGEEDIIVSYLRMAEQMGDSPNKEWGISE